MALRGELIERHHANRIAGHFGLAKTYESLGRQYWWSNMFVDCKAFCQSCDRCQREKASTQRPYGLLRPLNIPDERWDVVTMDYIMDLPMSNGGHTAVLIFIDKLTKYVHIAPCMKTCSAEEAARLFVTHVFQYHGLPKVFVSDRDTRLRLPFSRNLPKSLA